MGDEQASAPDPEIQASLPQVGLTEGSMGEEIPAVSKEEKPKSDQTSEDNAAMEAVEKKRKKEEEARNAKKTISDFMVGMLLGEGAYARVHVCKLKGTENDYFAVKVMEKRFIVKEGKVNFVNMEKKVLSLVEHPLVAKLYFSFHDERYLYMVIDLCRGGELQKLISYRIDENLTKSGVKNRACSIQETKFYVAETVSAVQYLHSLGFIHRDIKPDNILLSETGHIKLTDFGTVKDERGTGQEAERSGATMPRAERRGTFCGTAEYVSPEVLQDTEPSVGADLWAIGCLLYQLLVGAPPFRAGSEYFTFQLIMNHGVKAEPIRIPALDFCEDATQEAAPQLADADVAAAEDLINKLLVPEPSKRLGAGANCTPVSAGYDPNSPNGPAALRSHIFLQDIDIENVHNTAAPQLPYHYDIPEPKGDGASDQWMLAGDMTELELAAALEVVAPPVPPASETDSLEQDSQAALPVETTGQDPAVHKNRTSNGELQQFLKPSENIILDGLVVKRKGLFHTNTRHLILTDLPRFIYIDPVKVVQKGEIPITNVTSIHVKSNKTFDIITPKRTYHMTDLMSHASRWDNAFRSVTPKQHNHKTIHE